jgi:hypothetical protein
LKLDGDRRAHRTIIAETDRDLRACSEGRRVRGVNLGGSERSAQQQGGGAQHEQSCGDQRAVDSEEGDQRSGDQRSGGDAGDRGGECQTIGAGQDLFVDQARQRSVRPCSRAVRPKRSPSLSRSSTSAPPDAGAGVSVGSRARRISAWISPRSGPAPIAMASFIASPAAGAAAARSPAVASASAWRLGIAPCRLAPVKGARRALGLDPGRQRHQRPPVARILVTGLA